jgi:membrane associated rhomboid family serine protease
MGASGIITLVVVFITVLVSWRGFSSQSFFDKYLFEVDRILIEKDYKRLITSGFLHSGWFHLMLNMLALYSFGTSLEYELGEINFSIVYFISLLGGSLFSLYIHRNHGDYSAIGASGAVSGIVFASIALFPGMKIGLMGMSLGIPGWIYGVTYLLISIYGIKSKSDNIGHEAHLGGALIGLITAVIMRPSSLTNNYLPIILITGISVVFIYFIITHPGFLLIDNHFFKNHQYHTIEDRYNSQRVDMQKNVDRILEKIHQKGVGSLTKKEKELLDHYSSKVK